jgi:hypothetical protein
VPANHSHQLRHADRQAYAFQGVPDYQRKCQWPLVSAEGVEAMATWVWHGAGSKISKSWAAVDVQEGDSIVVRGQDGHREFWSSVFPAIRHPVTVITQAEGMDWLPGQFAAHLDDPKLLGWWSMNNDGRHLHPKMHSFPIGQLWKTAAESVLAVPEPPIRDILLYAVFSPNTHPDRPLLQKQLRTFPRALHTQRNRWIAPEENWRWLKRSEFVVSPWGAGPDCHRTYEALAAGAIPIVKRHSGLDPIFLGEPVVVVDQWSDLTPALLASSQVAALPNRSRITWLPFWVDRIMPQLNTVGVGSG